VNEPIAVTIDHNGVKIPGFIMKLNPTGLLVEIEKIPYRVGAILKIEFIIPETKDLIIEEVRAIKSYDRFFRSPPKAGKKEVSQSEEGGQSPPQAKKLAELHFVKAKESTRHAIMKLLMSLKVESLKKTR